MEKIDYGDINKFLVSTGLVLISLSLVLPYLYLREDFGLYITTDQIDKLNETVKQLVLARQNQVIIIQKIIPWLCSLLFCLGITSSTIGLKRWFKRQMQIDKKYDLDIQKLLLEIQSLTPDEQVSKAKNEVQAIELEQMVDTASENITSPEIQHSPNAYLKYLKVEKDITQVFRNFRSPNFEIYDQQKLGNRYELDLLLKATNKKYSD